MMIDLYMVVFLISLIGFVANIVVSGLYGEPLAAIMAMVCLVVSIFCCCSIGMEAAGEPEATDACECGCIYCSTYEAEGEK